MKTMQADGIQERLFLQQLTQRQRETDQVITKQVAEIIEQVRQQGDQAVAQYTAKFDGKLPEHQEVSAQQLQQALAQADQQLVAALTRAKDNIVAFHRHQMQTGFTYETEDGCTLGQVVRGLQRVGIYVPGGTAAYPSSVLMNAIPAKLAGVEEIIMVTPPNHDGTANEDILVAAAIAGVDRVFLVGGAQGVAALAYGTQTIPKVDKIVGPGNIYVATAKKLLYGVVDIDMIAGPSEILIIADDTANASYVAADLMSQAEHDPLAGSILLTSSQRLIQEVQQQLALQMPLLSRQQIIEQSLSQYGAMILFDTLEEMFSFSNEIAPEHLEVMVENPMQYLGQIRNAGSIFLGDYAPEPLGDYYAGPNHVLPTGGTARFFSPLSVESFIKKSSITYYTQQGLQRAKEDILLIAEKERLTAHANSIQVRFSS